MQLELPGPERTQVTTDWRPDTPPVLDGVTDIIFDTETRSLEWWGGEDIMIGLALGTPDGRRWYLPCNHDGGGNLDPEVVRRFCKEQLRGKRLTGANTKFDVQVMRNFGCDLEEQGCEVSDVQHYAALLDDTRRTFSLDELGKEFLGYGKVEGLRGSRMAEYHAGEVDAYAKRDIKLTHELRDHFWKKMDDEDLHEVRQLEDEVIWPVCEMERNATHLDLELLDLWVKQCEQTVLDAQWAVVKLTGMDVNPKSPDQMEAMFLALGIPITETTDNGRISLTAKYLKTVDHPAIKSLLRVAQLKSLASKYLVAYQRAVLRPDGNLRYNLHQLRSVSSEAESDSVSGAVSGRFSSSDINIQQVFNPARQKEKLGTDEFIIRKLFLPGRGKKWLSADAMQVEFRLVSHYAEPKEVLEAYARDPLTSFHKVVWKMVSEHTDISYKYLKDLNFAKVYGAGWKKCTIMMGLDITNDAEKLMGKKFCDGYDVRFPEIKDLLALASHVAETRGFVKTLTGRRARFPRAWRLHSALNRIVQGGAGDLMKKKLVELHKERKKTGFLMRFTVHDDVDGDVEDEESAEMVREILNRQTTELKVPILWDVKIGANWAECS